ncbi:MAG TPA: DUF4126 domain-containing protein [Anaerolineaceae bacterium]
METLRLLATLLPVSLTSGINLYATILVAGLSIRFGWVADTHPSLDVLASWPVLIIAGVFYLLQFFADKIQFVDNVWDFIHTFIRPIGAIMLGVTVLGNADPLFVMISALLSGGIALVSHSAKAGSHATLNMISPMENVSNIALSLGEDVVVGGLTFFALKYPFFATGIALAILILIILFVPQLIRWGWFMLSAFFIKIKAWIQSAFEAETTPDPLPTSHLALVEHRKPLLAVKCRGQNIIGSSGRKGYLSLFPDEITYIYQTIFGLKLWRLPKSQISAVYLNRKFLVDVLEVHYKDKKSKNKIARFVFMKDRTPLAERLAGQVASQTV